MSVLKEFSKDTLVYGFGKALKKFIGFLLLPLYTKALPPSEYGVLDTMGTLVFFITLFFNFGLDSAAGLYFFKPENEKEKGSILYTIFILRLIVIIPSLLCAFFSSQISTMLFSTAEYTQVVFITFLLIPATMLMSEQELIYRFYRNAWGFNTITIIKSIINIVAGILLVSNYKMGAFGAQMATFISTLIIIIVSYFTFTKNKYEFKFSKQWAKKMLKFGFPLIWSGIAVWVYSVSDRLFLLHYNNLGDIGHYSIGSTFAQPIGLINMAIQMSFGVLFYKIYHNESSEDKLESKKFMTQIVYIYISISAIITLALSVFSYEIISAFTTEDYLPGIITIPVLCISMIFAQIVEIVPVGISLVEKNWHYTWIILFAALINAGLNFIFIPMWGIFGAAITTLIANISYLVLADIVSKKYYNSGYSRIRTFTFLILCLLSSCYLPYNEIVNKISYPLYIKLIIVIGFCIVPFLFKFITIAQIKKALIKPTTS